MLDAVFTPERMQFLLLLAIVLCAGAVLTLPRVERWVLGLRVFAGASFAAPLPYCLMIVTAPPLLDLMFRSDRPALALFFSAALGACCYRYLQLYRFAVLDAKPL